MTALYAQDITAIEKRLYQGKPSAIQVDWTSDGAPMSDLFCRFPFRDDALRHMLALWHRGEQHAAPHPPIKLPEFLIIINSTAWFSNGAFKWPHFLPNTA